MLEDYSQGETLLIVGAVVVVGLVGLLVVTVVGAAVVGSFVLGVDGGETTTPQAEFSVEETADGVRIVHEGGDSIDTATLVVSVDGEWTDARAYDGTGGDGTFDADDSLAVTADSGSTVQLLWMYDDSEPGDVLLSYEVP